MSKLRDQIKEALIQKRPKDAVNYSVGHLDSHCGVCKYYDNHICKLVQGFIKPNFWCRLFEKK